MDTHMWHTLRGGHLKQSKIDKYRQKKCQSWMWKACAGGCPAVCISSCLSLISILGETLLVFAGLTGLTHWGRSCLFLCFFHFWNGAVRVCTWGCDWFWRKVRIGWHHANCWTNFLLTKTGPPVFLLSFCFTFASLSTLFNHNFLHFYAFFFS